MNTSSNEGERMSMLGRGTIPLFQNTTSYLNKAINPALPPCSFVFTAAGFDVDPRPSNHTPRNSNVQCGSKLPRLPPFQSSEIPSFDSTKNFSKVTVSDNYMATVKRTFETIFPEKDDGDKRYKQAFEETHATTPSSSVGYISRSVKTLFDANASAQKNSSVKDPSSFKRKWNYKKSKRYANTKHRGCTFSLLSYNVLAQGLLEGNRYLYKDVHPQFLDWQYRKGNLLRELLCLNGDILCLQEVERIHYEEFFQPALAEYGYAGVYKQRTGNKSDGCAIFFKTSQFNLAVFKAVSFRRSNIPLLDRDNVGVVALLQTVKEPKLNLCVATTHLLFNPRRGDIKLAQLGLFLAEIDKISHCKTEKGCYEQCPVILCGDMNSLPESPLSKFIQNGQMDFRDIPSGDISGQKEGRRGPCRFLGKPPIPSALNISSNCQYLSALDERKEAAPSSSTEDNESKEKSAKDDDESKSESTKEGDDLWKEVGATGSAARMVVRHPFKFSSVYPLEEENKAVTSNHSRTNCMVDYVFFSLPDDKSTTRNGTRGSLELLSSLQLFTDEEATEMGGLPNSVWSSDHFSLMASFHLKP